MIATAGGAPSFGSQVWEAESMARGVSKVEQDSNRRRMENVAGCFRRRFLAKDKDVPLL
jgi:hypothetical protein